MRQRCPHPFVASPADHTGRGGDPCPTACDFNVRRWRAACGKWLPVPVGGLMHILLFVPFSLASIPFHGVFHSQERKARRFRSLHQICAVFSFSELRYHTTVSLLVCGQQNATRRSPLVLPAPVRFPALGSRVEQGAGKKGGGGSSSFVSPPCPLFGWRPLVSHCCLTPWRVCYPCRTPLVDAVPIHSRASASQWLTVHAARRSQLLWRRRAALWAWRQLWHLGALLLLLLLLLLPGSFLGL
jgi:hypothetical protein